MFTTSLNFILLLCVGIQLGYAVYYFIPFIFYKPKVLTNPDFPVSVIIAAHNEEENLQRLLPALLKQDYKTYEVIVVDDRSTDNSKKYLAELSHKSRNLRILPIERTPPHTNPKKYALTQGIQAASYEHLLFTDADCVPVSHAWISHMMKGFCTDVGIVLGYSPYIAAYGFLNKLIRYETLISAIQFLSFSVKGDTYMGVGRNLAYTKSSFERVNGFNAHINTLGGDDDLFVQEAINKNKVNVVLAKESQTLSIPKQTYQDWVIQKRRHMSVGRAYKWPDKVRIGIYMLANILFYLTAFILLFVSPNNNLMVAGVLVGLRCVVIYLVYFLIAQKLREKLSVIFLPFLDLVYICNYLILGISVLMFKKVRWK